MPPKKVKKDSQPNLFAFGLHRVNETNGTAEISQLSDEPNTERSQSTAVSHEPPNSAEPGQSSVQPTTTDTQPKTTADTQPSTCSPPQIKSMPTMEALKLFEQYFPEVEKKGLHCFYTCSGVCSDLDGNLVSSVQKTDRKRKLDRFQHKWLTERETSFSVETGMWWLVAVEERGMFCLLCRIHNTSNKFNKLNTFNISPSTNFKRSAVVEHAKTQGHTEACKAEIYRRDSLLAQKHQQAQETKDVVTVNAFTSCYWLGKEEVANRKLKSLLSLEQEIGAKEMANFKNLSQRSQQDMRLLLGQLIKKHLISKVKIAQWFSVSVDEVTDCATMEQLLIFLGYVDEEGVPQFQYLEVKDVLEHSDAPDAETITKTILDELKASGLDVNKLCGFGSDGASVMTGHKNGVGARLQKSAPVMLRSHCINHRLALACGDANEKVGYITKAEIILRQLWSWLEYPKRCAAFVKTVKNYHEMNIPTNTNGKKISRKLAVKVQKACRTRWLSTGQSVSSVCRNLVPLVLTLRQFKETDATAHGLLTRINCCQFVGTMLLLNKILPQLNILSKLFQKDHTCYLSIKPALEATKSQLQEVRENVDLVNELEIALSGQYAELELSLSEENTVRVFLRNLVTSYTEALERNLDRRFLAAAPVFEAFSIFDPTCLPKPGDIEFKDYGKDKIEVLCEQFKFDPEETLIQWANFKYQFASWRVPTIILKGEGNLSPTEFILRKIVKEQACHRINFNYLVDAAQICLTQPMSNAIVERGASAVKRVKTRLRSRMKNVMLSSLLQVSLNGPPLQTESCSDLMTEAAKVWRRTHVRNLPPLSNMVLPKVGDFQHTDSLVHTRQMVDCGVQAGPEESEPLDVDVPPEPNLETDVQVETDVQAGAEEIYHNALKAMDMDSDSEESDVDSQFEFDMDDDFRE